MNVLLMANWGMGLEIFKALHKHPDIHKMVVVTKYKPAGGDPWENVLYSDSLRLGYKTIVEDMISFRELLEIIYKDHIDLLVAHAFMKILPEFVFNAPPKGSINIHASLLPEYRGASPSKQVLQNKEMKTGLTCHYIDKGIDTGDIISQVDIEVEPCDTVASLIEKGKRKVGLLINESLSLINDASFVPKKQVSA